MLFRRVKNHVENENWFAVLVDFCIVVLGIFIGFQITNWNENRSKAQDYQRAMERYKTEARNNIDYLNSAEKDFLGYFQTVPDAIEILRQCDDSPENFAKVQKGLERLRGSWGINIQTQALNELRTDPDLLAQQSPLTRHRFSDLSMKLELLQKEAEFVENKPLEFRAETNPILRLGDIKTGPKLTYNGIDFTRKSRPLELGVPLSEACKNDQLIKSFYSWEKWQSVVPLIITRMRAEIENSLDALE